MRSFLAAVAISTLLISFTGCAHDKAQRGDVATGFANPPASARPHTWWHWVSGNASKQGITADLEAMKRIGVGGAQMFFVDQVPGKKDGTPGPHGPVRYMSQEWRDLTKHAIAEADRLGLELTIHDCEGWSESGGPWITPEMSMQKVVWSEQPVHGGQTFDDKLAQPESVKDFYRDIAVFAFPSLPGEQVPLADLKPKLTTNAPASQPTSQSTQPATSSSPPDFARLIDHDPKTTISVAPGANHSAYLQIELQQPIRFGSFTIAPVQPNSKIELQVSDDGKTFRKLAEISTNRKANFPAHWDPKLRIPRGQVVAAASIVSPKY